MKRITLIRRMSMGLALLSLALFGALAYAQVGGGFDLSWSIIDGGGGTFSTGGSFSLGGTLGQPDAGSMSTGPYTLAGGFWAAAEVPDSTPTPINTPTLQPTQTPGGPSPTPTPTNTPINTPTPQPTQTVGGPSATPIPTNTHVNTPTNLPVNSPTSTPTNTRTPQPTQTPGGPTATPEPTHCPIEFTDVLPGSTFYAFIRCMACRGVIIGYTTGCETGNPCFRPSYNVTRGQIAKIVSNAAGFFENPGAQIYDDVPPTQTFYAFINRLTRRGIMSGYPCPLTGNGGDGEDGGCVPTDQRYFRPGANASRGQIAKIVSNAAGYIEPPVGQTFEDVPPDSPFYAFVQRLTSRDVMSGYPCSGPGEPCNPPLNRPYFRPASNATRGQTSKIVANTFFPECYTPQR